MHRCFIPPDQWTSSRITPAAAEQHHLQQVLRLKPGSRVLAFDGKGHEADARIEGSPEGLQLHLLGARAMRPRGAHIILASAIIKGARMDTLIEKATELGVARIEPILTTRTIVKVPAGDADRKADRWMRVAVSAAKQCGTPTLPQIAPITPFATWIQQCEPRNTPLLLAALSPDAEPLATAAQHVMVAAQSAVRFVVGPEGDFTPEEYAAARQEGARFVSLGPLVLRAETAAIYGVSVLQARSEAMPGSPDADA